MSQTDDRAKALQAELRRFLGTWAARHHVAYQEGLAAVALEVAHMIEGFGGEPDDALYSFVQAYAAAYPSKAEGMLLVRIARAGDPLTELCQACEQLVCKKPSCNLLYNGCTFGDDGRCLLCGELP